MEKFINALNKLAESNTTETREKNLVAAFGAVSDTIKNKSKQTKDKLGALIEKQKKESKESFYNSPHAVWIDEIPQLIVDKKPEAKKRLKKLLTDLIHLEYLTNCLEIETEEELLIRIRQAKKIKELEDLQNERTIRHFLIPSLKNRLIEARKRKPLETPLDIDIEIKARSTYLKKKKNADKAAVGLSAVVSSLGEGLVAGIAMVLVMSLIWPGIAIGGLIAAFCVFTVVGSVTEFFVYSGNVRTFCRQLVRGFFFQSIDDRIFNREAPKTLQNPYANRHQLSDDQKREIKKEFIVERMVKRTLVVAGAFLAAGAGVGFMGLAFSQVTEILVLFGLTVGGTALIAAPWLIAIIVGPIYAMVMYGMIYKAIKQNLFLQMWEKFKSLFEYTLIEEKKDGTKNETTYSILDAEFWQLDIRLILKHLGLCALKVLGIAAILAIAIVATLFTAGAWFESSIAFFTTALAVTDAVANWVGYGVGLVFLAINVWFSLDKSLETFASFIQLKAKNVWHSIKKIFSSPENVAEFFVNNIPLSVHITGKALVARQGGETPLLQGINRDIGAACEGGLELAEDAGSNGLEAHVHHYEEHIPFPRLEQYTGKKKEQHNHEHGNLYRSGKKAVVGLLSRMGVFAESGKKGGEKAEAVEPVNLPRVGIRPRTV